MIGFAAVHKDSEAFAGMVLAAGTVIDKRDILPCTLNAGQIEIVPLPFRKQRFDDHAAVQLRLNSKQPGDNQITERRMIIVLAALAISGVATLQEH